MQRWTWCITCDRLQCAAFVPSPPACLLAGALVTHALPPCAVCCTAVCVCVRRRELFIYIFDHLNARYAAELAAVGQQYPFEPLKVSADAQHRAHTIMVVAEKRKGV
jgi:hypothetical protein